MELEVLPDELLLRVFRWLDTQSLLRARAVCRRWSVLGLHPQVWRRVSIHDLSAGKQLFKAVLSLAPCVGHLSLNLDHPQPIVITTCCAARTLSLSVWDDRATIAWRVLKRQLELGNLREFRVHMHGDFTLFSNLMKEVNTAQGLVKLTLQNYRPPIGGEVLVKPKPASLIELYSDTPHRDRHLQFLLHRHRSTLEVVSLPACVDAPMRILATLRALRRVECPPLKDMQLFAACPDLRSLTIRMEPSAAVLEKDVPRVREAVEGTAAFLSATTQLKELRLFPEDTVPGLGLVKTLLLAPTLRGQSALEGLELVTTSARDSFEHQRTLAGALPLLPRLRRITLSCLPTPVMLAAISPLNVPLLRELYLIVNRCAHWYIHQPEVESLMVRNPELHLLTRDNSHCHHGKPCDPCRSSCHAVLANPARSPNVAFFVHGELELCGVEVHDIAKNVYTWVRL